MNWRENDRAVYERALLETRVGRAFAHQRRFDQAIASMQSSVVTLDRLHRAQPDDVQRTDELALSQLYLGETLRDARDPRACEVLGRSAALFDEMSAKKTLRWRSREIARRAAPCAQ
jgi:hypothetical protein